MTPLHLLHFSNNIQLYPKNDLRVLDEDWAMGCRPIHDFPLRGGCHQRHFWYFRVSERTGTSSVMLDLSLGLELGSV